MRKRLAAGLLSTVMLLSSVQGAAMAAPRGANSGQAMAEIYVSASAVAGKGDGSIGKPYASMEEARKAVQKLNKNMTGDIIVNFEEGEYLLDRTVAFTQEDSGSNGYQIIYKAQQPGKSVITSGLPITGWKDAEDKQRPGLLEADAEIDNTRQFYVDGEMAVRAKGRIGGSMDRSGDKITYTTYNGSHDAYKGFLSSNTEIQNWRNPTNMEFVWDISWAHRISPVKSITSQGDKSFIEMEWDSFKTGQIAGGVQINGAPSYVENAYELLDEPGEWYFDSTEKKIYYMPKKGQDMSQAEAIIPSVENLITVEGSLDNKVSDLSFEGFDFTYNTWLYPSSKGWPEQQANFAHDPREEFNMHAYSLAPGAAIVTKMTDGITFDGCTFQQLGSAGINMLDGSVGNTVKNCVFKDLSAGGVLVGGVSITEAHPLKPGDTIENHIKNKTPHDDRLIVKDNTITNNYFNGIGTEYKGSIAIVAGYTDGTVITNNTIRDVAYSGISVGWGWGFWDQGGRYIDGKPDNETPTAYPVFPIGDAVVSRNNVIDKNEISQCMMKLHDGAGIYTLGDMPGSSISGNVIHDNVGWPGGIYLDEGSGGMTVDKNILYNVQVNLNHNVRDHTYGYRFDHYVDGGNNYFGKAPGDKDYPVEEADKAGVQENDGVSIIPIELNKLTAPEFVSSGDRVLLEGNFGKEAGRVILEGENAPVVLEADSSNIISWTVNKILLRMPGGVVTGSVYIETADKIQSNAKKINVGSFTEELFKDDFEAYADGTLKDQEAAANHYSAITDAAVVEQNEDGSKFLRIQKPNGSSDARLERTADWTDVVLSMDLRYDVNPNDFGGLFLSPRFQDHNNKYLVLLTPNYAGGLGYQQYIDGSINGPGGGGQYSYKVGTWYSTKLAIVGQEMKVKIWEKGKPEPSLWNNSTTFSGLNKGGLLIQLTSLRDGEKASIDNLSVLGYQPGVTEDVSDDRTAPITTASVTGDKSQEETATYNSQVKVSLSAEDQGTGVADIEYQIGDGEFHIYTEPLLFGTNGEYSISYRSADRTGNTEKLRTIRFKVDLQPGDLVFEDNFDDYEAGKLTDLEKKGYTAVQPDAIEIENVDGSNMLKLNGIGSDVRLYKNANWENTVMSFRYKFQKPLGGLEGLYPSNYFQSLSPDSMYAYPMLPGWGGILLQQNVRGNADNQTGISNNDYPLQADTWYNVKMQTSTNHMAFKIWTNDVEEPQNWMAERNAAGLEGGGGAYFSFSSPAGNAAYIDNVQVRNFERKAEKTRVEFNILPENAKVVVVNAQAEKDGSYLLPAGTYTYTISADGYKDLSGTFETDNEMTKSIYLALEKYPVDRAQLDTLIEQACNITDAELTAYTDETVSRLRSALESAIKLNDLAIQKEINAAAQELDAAIKGLVKKPVNRTQLNALIQRAGSYTDTELQKYTDDSVRNFRAALDTATKLSLNAAQAEVDAAARALEGAINRLVKKAEVVAQPIEVSKLSISSIPRQTHTGTPRKPAVTVKYGTKVLKVNVDYTLSYSNNIKPGTAKLTLTGKGGYKGTITKTFVIAAKKDKIYTVGSYQYRVLNSSVRSGTVRFLKPVKKTLKTAKVPAAVKIGNFSYKVTEIGKNAFKNNKKLTSVVIDKNVTKIHESAFSGDKLLKKITVKSKVIKSVGKNAFKGIHSKACIKVPSSKLKQYKKIMTNKGQSKTVIIRKQ